MNNLNNQFVSFSSPRTAVSDYTLQTLAAGGGPLAGISGVANTPALLPQSQQEPMPGASWMADVAPLPVREEMPPPPPPAVFEYPQAWELSLPGPSRHIQYNPLDAMASMMDTFSMEEVPAGLRRFSWHNAAESARPERCRRYAASAQSIASLAETMVAASQTDTLLNEKEMLEASQRLRRQLNGNRRQIRVTVLRPFRVPLANVASVYETLHGWGLFRINSEGATDCAVDSKTRQNSLLRLRKLISEKVILGIHNKQLSTSSPASEQQQQFAEIVLDIYQSAKDQALQQLNEVVPPGGEYPARRLTESSTRALVDEMDPADTTPQFTLNVQGGEQVALTFALLLRLKPRPVPAEQLRTITFNGAEDNHSVVLYACSPACQFSELSAHSSDPRAPISTDHFLSWLFNQRRHVLILDPRAEDSMMGRQVAEVKYNAFTTNKCIAFYTCQSRQQIMEGVASLLHQTGIGLSEINITLDHPLAEANESALENARDETDSECDSDIWNSSLEGMETESETEADFSHV